MDELKVTVQIDERDILNVQSGQHASIKLDALPDEEFSGTISSISGSPKTGEGTSKYSVDVNLYTDKALRNGLSADVTIDTGKNENVLIVPVDAIQDSNDRKFVYTTQNDDGTLGGEVDVTTGLSNDNYVEITSGLKQGEIVYYPKVDLSQDLSTELTRSPDETSSDSGGSQ